MINITETAPIKLSGLSSFCVKFNYRSDIVDILKNYNGPYSYCKKTYEWEFPELALSYLLNNLTYLDDITLKLKKENGNSKKINELSINYKTKPYPYQLEGIKYGLNHDKWLLLDAPGLGKSLQIIYIAEELHKQRKLKHCLIVCGVNILKANWKEEIATHSTLDCRVLGENISPKGNITYSSIEDRAKELKGDIKEFFIITNIESFRDKRHSITNKNGKETENIKSPLLEALNNSPNNIDMVVVDEVHKLKDYSSQQSKNFIKVKSKYKVAVTGTLLLNNPIDAYVPLVWTENEHSTVTNFKKQYCEFGGFGGHQIIGYKNLGLLKEEIDNCSLRRTKDILNLPAKNIINELVDLNDEQNKFYEEIKQGVKSSADKIELNTSSLLALVIRLRQASILPSMLTAKEIKSSKIERCCDLVEQIVSQGDKVVIMSTFVEPTEVLKKLLIQYKPLMCTGKMKEADIDINKQKFQNEEENKVFISTYAKGSTGITLNKASYMICLDECWTDAQNTQAQDRIHRVTNTKPVFIYNLIAKGTIDEHVHQLAQTKREISDYMIDNKLNVNFINNLRNIILDL